ncbi:MAG: hypothetical protein QM756_10605 [Polyangiaceae bacterium]
MSRVANVRSAHTEAAGTMPDGDKYQCCECLEDIEPGTPATRNQNRVLMHAQCPTEGTQYGEELARKASSAPGAAGPRDFGDLVADEYDRQRTGLGQSVLESTDANSPSRMAAASSDFGDLVADEFDRQRGKVVSP